MSKNSLFTFTYSQPNEYRFSLDSIFLAQVVANHLKSRSDLSQINFLDLCAGCGVIGLELSIHLPQIEKFDFLEVQEIYRDHFEHNLKKIHSKEKLFHYYSDNYAHYRKSGKENYYDIIVSNPPYFFPGEGLLSPSEFKNRCRFFLDSDFKSFIQSVLFFLRPKGEAFLLVRPGVHHGRDLYEEIRLLISLQATCEIFDEVRGTNIIRIIKKV